MVNARKFKPFEYECSLLKFMVDNERILYILARNGLINTKTIRNYHISRDIYKHCYLEKRKRLLIFKRKADEFGLSLSLIHI